MKLKIGITIGDINGIGPEVIIKALSNDYFTQRCTPIIYGSSKSMGYHKNIVDNGNFSFVNASAPEKATEGKINVLSCWQDAVNINIGEATIDAGKCAYIALDKAMDDLNNGLIDALVTAPINKHAMKMADFPYLGHTDFIAEKTGAADSLMFMISENLKIALVTTHIPISEVTEHITADRILDKLELLDHSLKVDFGIEKPVIAVLGLNPHAGDEGEIGNEDESQVKPAINAAKENGILAHGPYAADGFFGSNKYKKFDAILAMYHDQGLVPFKSLAFGNGVNFTAGLDVIRTSPDHGTGYEIAGQNIADESSFRQALFAAIDIAKSRKEYEEMNANSIENVVEHKEEIS